MTTAWPETYGDRRAWQGVPVILVLGKLWQDQYAVILGCRVSLGLAWVT